MNILMTTDTVGGVWTYSLQLAKALAPMGVRVVLAAKGRLTADQRAAAEQIGSLTLAAADYKLEWMPDPWDDVAQAGCWLMDLCDLVQPDVIHLNDYCHGALPWPAPVVMVGHSCVLSWMAAVRGCEASSEWDHYRELVTRGLQSADVVIAPTFHMLSALTYFYGPLIATNVIPNGCEAPRFRRQAKQPCIFSAGRLWDEGKNIAALAKAAPFLDWPVRVAGMPHPDGQDGEVAGVQWLGRLSAEEMDHEYWRASIYALPALYEPFGLTPLEAALRGCVLVLGDIPTFREIWGDAACFVSPRDDGELADAINRLCRDDALRRHYVRRAAQVAQTLTASRMARGYLNLYSRLCARPRAMAGHV